MKVTWIGQGGLLIETEGVQIMIDPYLSDSVAQINPKNYRRIPVDETLFQLQPDIMVFTHCHLDHYDPETVEKYITPETSITVLAPSSVWPEVRKIGGANNYVQFDRYTSWTEGSVRFRAVKAVHSDVHAIGVILCAEGKNHYITGDTLYNEEIFGDINEEIDTLFLPVNGVGNNMNMADAARFARRIGAKKVVPIHIGLFDEIRGETFPCENKVLPEIYRALEM